MTDYASFKHGGVTYPLPASGSGIGGAGASLLRDADPAIFYALQFFASVLDTHVGTRLVAAALAAGQERITSAVAETLPLNPEPFLTSEHIRFPLLALYRKSTAFRYIGTRKIHTYQMELAYVLPPMLASEAEQLLPILHAVEVVLDQRCEQGFDPSYTPSTPAGTAGETVWSADRAGLVKVGITGSTTGAYTPTADLFFPAVVMTLEMEERSMPVLSELDTFAGADITEDVVALDTTYADFLVARTLVAPVLTSLTPATGTKAGGTAVTLTGTSFVVGRSYRVLFGDADADSVVAASTTSITCLTPQHAAYPTLAADVYVIDQDDQLSNTLSAAFTFTTP